MNADGSGRRRLTKHVHEFDRRLSRKRARAEVAFFAASVTIDRIAMPREVVGREPELASIRAFIDAADGRAAALVLEGEAGIGKSTLWLAGVEHARSRGLRVLSSRPAEAEVGLTDVGLGDLLDDVLDEVVPQLLAPRRRALEIALLREEMSDEPVDYRALGVAVRDVLQLLSVENPLLLAVDDVQWLDGSSASALAFALRRIGDGRVLVLLARRLVDDAAPSELEQALPNERVERLPVGALSVGALHRLLRDRLGRTFARQTLLHIHERSGGNPFFALELTRVLDADIDPFAPLELPESLDELVRGRIAALPAATRNALALASALGAPSEALLARAGIPPDALAAADVANVIERKGGVVRFTHPLLSSALYPDADEERRAVHARIAAIVDDPVLRARHLALSRVAPDPEIAGVLDEAARVAADRGAAAAAAELAEHALRLTPTKARGDLQRRALGAARAHRAAGEWTRAKTIASDLLTNMGRGALRAEALVFLADLEATDRAMALLEEGMREAGSRPALQAVIHCKLAWTRRFADGFEGSLGHARAAFTLADELDDDGLRVDALVMLAFLGSAVGDPEAPAHAARAYELARGTDDARRSDAAYTLFDLFELDDIHGARALFEGEYQAWHERDELRTADILFGLSWLELWAGRWQIAAEHAARAYEIKIQYALEAPWDHLPIAVIAAHRGQLDVARAHSERALRLGEEQIGLHTPVHLGTMGIVALQGGDLPAAAAWFAEAEAQTTRLDWHGPGHRWWTGDHVEALLALDQVDEAVRLLDAWEADARRLRRESMLAHVARCRGLIAAVRNDVAAAATLLEDAVAQHEHVGDRFGRARALLALGVVRRRERQKRAARDAIEAAVEEFEQLGAVTWAEKARSELGRIGGRTRVEGLTPAERRVATLVAQGRTNREVAAALFLGQRTVETHLSHVYAKLGVRSRAELARTFRPDEQSSGGLAISS